ncbi:MAG TPA: PDZ domain-containing protein, partial [Flavihumibacter sp.]
EWLGAMLKNIETLGEQSASGAPDRKGVLIQSVARGSLAEKNGLAAGDVIRSVNETAINDLNHFLSEVQKMNWKGEIEAAILHNQQLVKKALRLK